MTAVSESVIHVPRASSLTGVIVGRPHPPTLSKFTPPLIVSPDADANIRFPQPFSASLVAVRDDDERLPPFKRVQPGAPRMPPKPPTKRKAPDETTSAPKRPRKDVRLRVGILYSRFANS